MQLRRCRAHGTGATDFGRRRAGQAAPASASATVPGSLSATPAGQRAWRARRRRSWALLQGELVLGAWAELDGLVADEDLDGLGRPGPRPDQQVVLDEGDVDPVAAIVDAEADLLDLWRQGRVEAEHLPPGPQAGEAAQHDVDRPGHRAQVDPL